MKKRDDIEKVMDIMAKEFETEQRKDIEAKGLYNPDQVKRIIDSAVADFRAKNKPEDVFYFFDCNGNEVGHIKVPLLRADLNGIREAQYIMLLEFVQTVSRHTTPIEDRDEGRACPNWYYAEEVNDMIVKAREIVDIIKESKP